MSGSQTSVQISEQVKLKFYTRGRWRFWGPSHKAGNSSLGSGPWKGSRQGRGAEFQNFTGSKLGPGDRCMLGPQGPGPIPSFWESSPPAGCKPQECSLGRDAWGRGWAALISFTHTQACQLWVKALHFARAALEIQPTPCQELPRMSAALGLRGRPSPLAGARRCEAGIQAGPCQIRPSAPSSGMRLPTPGPGPHPPLLPLLSPPHLAFFPRPLPSSPPPFPPSLPSTLPSLPPPASPRVAGLWKALFPLEASAQVYGPPPPHANAGSAETSP